MREIVENRPTLLPFYPPWDPLSDQKSTKGMNQRMLLYKERW